jgi:hypothetical protein
MTLRRKIAEMLRRAARAIDDTPRVARAEIDARISAVLAIPRAPNRFVARKSFANVSAGKSILDDPAVLEQASTLETREPGLYAENPDMMAAIRRFRAGRAA